MPGTWQNILPAVHQNPQPTAASAWNWPARAVVPNASRQLGLLSKAWRHSQRGGNKMGLWGEIKRTGHLYFLPAVIPQHGMLFTWREGKGKVELLKKEPWLWLFSWTNWYVQRTFLIVQVAATSTHRHGLNVAILTLLGFGILLHSKNYWGPEKSFASLSYKYLLQ